MLFSTVPHMNQVQNTVLRLQVKGLVVYKCTPVPAFVIISIRVFSFICATRWVLPHDDPALDERGIYKIRYIQYA